MQVTLRQAHKIVEKITARLAMLDINPTREINVWEVTDTTFDDAVETFNEQVVRTHDLMLARHFVRGQIGNANFAEVNSLIAQRKLLLDRIGMLRSLVAGAKVRAVTSQAGLVEKARAMTAGAAAGGRSTMFGEDTVTILVVDQTDLDNCAADIDTLQLEIETVEDKLTTANSNREHMVILSDEVIETLQSEGIIA
jgi:hypothetical protein